MDRAAHCGNPACLVDGGADHGEIEALAAADVAVKHFANMKSKVHVSDGQATRSAPRIQFGNSVERGRGCRQRRGASTHAIVGGKDRQRAIADELQNVTAMIINR